MGEGESGGARVCEAGRVIEARLGSGDRGNGLASARASEEEEEEEAEAAAWLGQWTQQADSSRFDLISGPEVGGREEATQAAKRGRGRRSDGIGMAHCCCHFITWHLTICGICCCGVSAGKR